MDHRLVDTGPIFGSGIDLFNVEFAKVSGPLSFQGEAFYCITRADDSGDPHFWGFYAYASYFLTGEHRQYDRKTGHFVRLRQEHRFRPFAGEWGSWELGLRYSFLDLNDEDVEGGKEANLTLGLNWYLNRNYWFKFNYIRVNVWNRGSPPIDDEEADVLQLRFQLSF